MVARIGISPGVAHPNIISFIGQDVRQGLKKSTRWHYNMMITACRITQGSFIYYVSSGLGGRVQKMVIWVTISTYIMLI